MSGGRVIGGARSAATKGHQNMPVWRPPCHSYVQVSLEIVSEWDDYLELCPRCGGVWFVSRRATTKDGREVQDIRSRRTR